MGKRQPQDHLSPHEAFGTQGPMFDFLIGADEQDLLHSLSVWSKQDPLMRKLTLDDIVGALLHRSWHDYSFITPDEWVCLFADVGRRYSYHQPTKTFDVIAGLRDEDDEFERLWKMVDHFFGEECWGQMIYLLALASKFNLSDKMLERGRSTYSTVLIPKKDYPLHNKDVLSFLQRRRREWGWDERSFGYMMLTQLHLHDDDHLMPLQSCWCFDLWRKLPGLTKVESIEMYYRKSFLTERRSMDDVLMDLTLEECKMILQKQHSFYDSDGKRKGMETLNSRIEKELLLQAVGGGNQGRGDEEGEERGRKRM